MSDVEVITFSGHGAAAWLLLSQCLIIVTDRNENNGKEMY